MILSNAKDFLGFEVSSPNSLPRPEVRLPTSRASHSSHRCSIVSSPRPQSLQSVGEESSAIACHAPPQRRVVSSPESHQRDPLLPRELVFLRSQATSIELSELRVRQLGAPPCPPPGDRHPGCQVDSNCLLRQLAPLPCHLVSCLVPGEPTVGSPGNLLAVVIKVPQLSSDFFHSAFPLAPGGLEQGHAVRYQGSSGPSLSLSQPPDTASSAAASAVKKLQYLPAGRESLLTSSSTKGASFRRSIHEKLEVGRSHSFRQATDLCLWISGGSVITIWV